MESSFAIIAEPNRRTILSLLASSERSVGELERRLRLPQTSVSKHLRVLREAGFVEARVEAQRRRSTPGFRLSGASGRPTSMRSNAISIGWSRHPERERSDEQP